MPDPAKTPFSKQLPSHKDFYSKFESSTGTCADDTSITIRNYLNIVRAIENPADKIVNAACYASAMYDHQKNTHKKQRCNFLYFWIGHLLFNNFGKVNYRSPLFYICNFIHETYKDQGCEIICKPVDKELLKKMKITYDFSYDYQHINDYLQYYNANHNEDFTKYLSVVEAAKNALGPKCTGASSNFCRDFWNEHEQQINDKLTKLKSKLDYLQKTAAQAAHSAMDTHCTDGTTCSYDYCTKFGDVNKTKIQEELSKLQSELASAQEIIAQKESEAELALSKAQTAATKEKEDAVRSATTRASITSVLGTLGLTAVPFLLYKYTELPSMISNTFGLRNNSNRKNRRNRRKRSTEHHHLDELTEETSTIGPTTENDSTDLPTTDYSTTLRSAASYTRQSRGRRNNAGGHGIVGYQNM